MWSFFDLIITESRLSIVRFDHSWHLMSTLIVIRSFARLLSHQPWGLWNKMTSPYSKVLRQSRQILTLASSPYVLCCFDFEIRTPDIKLETENVNIFAATMTPVVYFCRSHRYRCSLKVAIQRSFARSKF